MSLFKDVPIRLGWAGVKGKNDDVILYDRFLTASLTTTSLAHGKKTLHTDSLGKKAYFNPGPKEIDLKDVERLTFDIRDHASIIQAPFGGCWGPLQT